ncbi:hypothetical protein ABZ341_39235 [Streptomyces sp. NPDC006173]|uniref:hypothetical protein n=1 Tax=Streptomyces sp. NPDC006173 TaxID=3155349 RepID=UPI0033F7C686
MTELQFFIFYWSVACAVCAVGTFHGARSELLTGRYRFNGEAPRPEFADYGVAFLFAEALAVGWPLALAALLGYGLVVAVRRSTRTSNSCP